MAGDSDDHDEDTSDEEAFHPNYIPQCFLIDGSRGKMTSEFLFVHFLPSMLVKWNSF